METIREKKYVVISFSDTGPGIEENNINNIFEPFYTTKNRGQGTGLGLAICRDIVSKYNGTIDAENREQGGSRFVISLPIESEPVISK
jgi:signal transduction histidine kinase